MTRAVLIAQTRPSSPEQLAEYHRWYNEIHLRDVVALDGFISARRFEPLDGAGSFVAIYEMESDDIDAAVARLKEAVAGGEMYISPAMDTSTSTQLLGLIAEYQSAPPQ